MLHWTAQSSVASLLSTYCQSVVNVQSLPVQLAMCSICNISAVELSQLSTDLFHTDIVMQVFHFQWQAWIQRKLLLALRSSTFLRESCIRCVYYYHCFAAT